MTLSKRQKAAMYRLKANPVELQQIHTATLASLLTRKWVHLRRGKVHATEFGKQAFAIEVQRDFKLWRKTLHDTALAKRKAKRGKQ